MADWMSFRVVRVIERKVIILCRILAPRPLPIDPIFSSLQNGFHGTKIFKRRNAIFLFATGALLLIELNGSKGFIFLVGPPLKVAGK